MIIGFTGTQKGMTPEQYDYVELLLERKMDEIECVHHGDCIGADSDFDYCSSRVMLKIVIHPPINPSKRAFCWKRRYEKHDWVEPKEYLERNHDIVDACDMLMATPGEFEEILRSGTWATIRYARKKGKKIFIIFPDGSIKKS